MRKASSFLCLRDEVCEDIAGRRSQRGAASRAGKQSQPDRFLGRRSLGSPTLVTMMETTDLRDRKNRTRIGRLHSARFRGILLQCQMSSCLVIVIGISPQMTPQAAFVEHDHLIQALPANAANHPLNMRSLPGRTRSRQHLLDSHRLHLLDELMAEDAVAITQ